MKVIAVLFVLTSTLFMVTTCSDNCPVCPKKEVAQYRLYAVDDYGYELYVIDIPSDTVLFSIPIDYSVRSMFVSRDGSRLMVGSIDALATLVYDTRDLSVIDTLEGMLGYYYCDYSDDYIALASTLSADPDIKILDPVNLEPRFTIERAVRTSFLDTVSNCLYGEAAVEANLVYKIDCNTGRLVDSFRITTNGDQIIVVQRMFYNWLNDLLYFHAKISPYQSCFYQYDLLADSALDSTIIVEDPGSAAISPDGRKIYMTEGGNAWFGIRPPGYIRIYNAFTHQVEDSVLPPDLDPYGHPWSCYYRDILITPDGSRAYIGAGGNAAVTAPLPIYSINLDDNTRNVGAMPTSSFSASVISIGPAP